MDLDYGKVSNVVASRILSDKKKVSVVTTKILDISTWRRDTTSNWNPCPRVSEVGCFNFAFFVYYFDHFCSEKLSANHGHTFLSANEWSSLRELCLVLKPFEEVTIELSAENYVTLSKLIPMVSILQNQLASVMNDVPLYEQSSKISVCFNRR